MEKTGKIPDKIGRTFEDNETTNELQGGNLNKELEDLNNVKEQR